MQVKANRSESSEAQSHSETGVLIRDFGFTAVVAVERPSYLLREQLIIPSSNEVAYRVAHLVTSANQVWHPSMVAIIPLGQQLNANRWLHRDDILWYHST